MEGVRPSEKKERKKERTRETKRWLEREEATRGERLKMTMVIVQFVYLIGRARFVTR